MKGLSREQLLFAVLLSLIIVLIPVLSKYFSRGATFIRAVKHGALNQAESLLDTYPELINVYNGRNRAAPLHWAVIVNKPKIVELLILKGANINASDESGMTPLHKAADFNRKDIAEYLLSNGADVNVFGYKYGGLKITPLHIAAEAGFTDLIDLFLDAGADINIKSKGKNHVTALHISAGRGNWTVVELLLKRHADVNARDSYNTTPLHWAIVAEQDEVSNILRIYGGVE